MALDVEEKWRSATDLLDLLEQYESDQLAALGSQSEKHDKSVHLAIGLSANHRHLASEKIRKELMRGYRTAYGISFRNEQSGLVERIPAEFWAEAEFGEGYIEAFDSFYDREPLHDPHYRKFFSIRVSASRIRIDQAGHNNVTLVQEVGTGTIPKIPDLRRQAIEACYKCDRWIFDPGLTNLQQRHQKYIEWISSNYPQIDTDQRGLKEKTFEKDETIFKKNNVLTSPKK